MTKYKTVVLTVFSVTVLWLASPRAQEVPISGLYQIMSGSYTECCGIGGELTHPLPDATQGFVELIIDSQRNFAQMTFLGQDMHTILSIPADGPRSGFTFLFRDGEVLSDHIQFGEPIPLPEQDQPSFSYAVSNATDTLRINGGVVTPCPGCADFFTRFEHTNLVAVLKSTPAMPRLSLTALSTDGVFGFIIRDGRWGQTNVVEASADLITWTPCLEDYFPESPLTAATLSPSLIGTGLKAVINLPSGTSKMRTLPS